VHMNTCSAAKFLNFLLASFCLFSQLKFIPEDVGSVFVRNIGEFQPGYTAPDPIRPLLKTLVSNVVTNVVWKVSLTDVTAASTGNCRPWPLYSVEPSYSRVSDETVKHGREFCRTSAQE
jgi:hypothetical protein